MTYYAEIDASGIVQNVIVADTDYIAARSGVFVETWLDGGARKNYAGIGYSYDAERDAFIAPSPGDGWLLDEAACQWKAAPAVMWERIKAERDRRSEQGGYTVGGKWFHSDVKSRTQQLGLVLLGANIPANTLWKTMDGSFVTMTQTLAAQIFGAAAAQDMATFGKAEAHKAAMEASDNPLAYDFSSGWPVIFEG